MVEVLRTEDLVDLNSYLLLSLSTAMPGKAKVIKRLKKIVIYLNRVHILK